MPEPISRFSSLSGKVAIVTGGSRGIGRSIALEFARRGAMVAVTYVSPNSATAVSDLVAEIDNLETHSSCVGIQADLRDPESVGKVVEQTVTAFGDKIDILVNNAGAELVKGLQDVTLDDFDFIYHLNVRAPVLLLQHILPHLQTSGRVVNIGSVGARQGFKNLSLYCSSKAALEGLSRCWAAELGARGITINTVNPGPVQSDMLNNIPKDLVDMQKKLTPIENRLGTFDDIAQIVAWLASEESRWVTGQSISASGGFDMY